MSVTTTADEALCPFCQSNNACMSNMTAPCWCNQANVPQALRDLLPKEKQNTICICSNCITSFNQDKTAFSLKHPKSF